MESDSSFALQKFHELLYAHKSTIIVYSRNPATDKLAKKFRPEFSRLFLVSKFEEIHRLVTKYNDGDDPTRRIGLILADFDFSSPRLFDYIQSRPQQEKTMKSPLISVVFMAPENADRESRDFMSLADGTSTLIRLPCSTKKIFFQVIEVLSRKKMVEATHKDLKQNLQSTKYPFLPIFAHKDHHDDSEPHAHNGSGEEEIHTMDDFLECESLLNDEMNNYRKQERENLNLFRDGPDGVTREMDLRGALRERHAIDKKLVLRLALLNRDGQEGAYLSDSEDERFATQQCILLHKHPSVLFN